MAKAANQKSRMKYYLVTLLVILIVAFALGYPRYKRYEKQRRINLVHNALEALQEHVDTFWKTHGSIGGYDIDKALAELKIPASTRQNWDFAIAWKDTEIYTTELVAKLKDVSENKTVYVAPYRLILAVAKAGNPVREGRKAWFDGDENRYHGFGYDELVEPNWRKIFPLP